MMYDSVFRPNHLLMLASTWIYMDRNSIHFFIIYLFLLKRWQKLNCRGTGFISGIGEYSPGRLPEVIEQKLQQALAGFERGSNRTAE